MLIVLEVDGVLDIGEPRGPVPTYSLVNLARTRTHKVVLIGDYEKVFSRVDVGGHLLPVSIAEGDLPAKLRAHKMEFPGEDRYIFVASEDTGAASEAGYVYMSPQDFLKFLEGGLML